jgi:hypothetical protein
VSEGGTIPSGSGREPCGRASRAGVLRTALALAAVALCLRTYALSSGPGEGTHYHPDVAKQVRAVQQFLHGDYLVIRHRNNYDGYPLFNSHLVEYAIRIAHPPLQAALRWVGGANPGTPPLIPDPGVIAWAMLFWNVFLSTAAAVLAFLLGRRFGSVAGVLAGTMAAVSPLDVAAAHYAANDTAAAFFALLAVYLAIRIVETGRVRHYLLGALATAAAFSSKYNGAEAGIALAVAHLARHPGKALLSGAAWRRVGAAAGALVLGVLLTSPAFLVNPGWTIVSIRDFLAWVASYGLTEADLRMTLGERFLGSLRNNGLLVIRSTGLFTLAGVAAALTLARPRKLVWVVAALPLAHLLIAFAAKPVEHAVHLLPIVLPLMVLGAAGMASLLARDRPLPVRSAGAICAVGAIVWLAAAARDELFFFSRSDTRRVAETWAQDSVPRSVAINAGRSFPQPPQPGAPPLGTVEFFPPKYWHQSQPGEFRLTRFFLEENSLPDFRNQGIDVTVRAPALLAPDFALPIWLPLPSVRADDVAFVDAPAFYRSPLVRDVKAEGSFDVTAVSRRPLARAWLVLRAGAGPVRVTAGFGGRSVERLLRSTEPVVIPIEHPRPQRSAYQGNHFYRWTARARLGSVRVALVTDEAILGRCCFNGGLFADAWRALADTGGGQAPPGRRIEQAIAGLASGSLTGAAAEALAGDLLTVSSWDRGEVRARFGIHPDWLDGVPYIELAAESSTTGSVPDEQQEGETSGPLPVQPALATPEVMLESGRYLLEISGISRSGPMRLAVRDACGRVLRRIDLAPPEAVPSPEGLRVALQIPAAFTYSFVLTHEQGGELPVGARLKLRPDVVGSVRGRLDLLRRLMGRAVSGDPGPADYDALLAAGDAARTRGDLKAASALFRLAAVADPGRRSARERLGERVPLPPPQPVKARFRKGIELVSLRTDPEGLHPGGSVRLQMQWRLPEDLARPDRIVCWVHAVDGAGRIVFQGDHALLDDTRAPAGDDREEACMPRFTIPPGTAPGSYELRAGLWQPKQGTRIRVLEAAVPHDRTGLSLGTITVGPDRTLRP